MTVVAAVTALLGGFFGVLVGTAQADAPALSGSTSSYTVAFGTGLPSGTNTVVASFTDYDASSTFAVNINWGDGTTDTNYGGGLAAVVAAGTLGGGNLFNVEDNHNYAVPGVYPVTVDICDEPDSLVTLTSCADAADTSSNGGALFGAFTSSSPGILPLAGGTITVTDIAGSSTGFGAVEAAAPTAQTVASFTDLDGSLLSELVATIDWGDGFCCPPAPDTSPGTIVATGPGSFSVTGTKPFPYPDEGSYPITVTITDPTGVVPGSGSPLAPAVLSGGTVVVSDAALTAGSPVTITGTEGTATTYGTLGTFADAGFAPFPCGGFPFPPCDFTATIDWGDGGPTSAGDLSQVPCFLCPPPPWLVSGSHTYAEAGTYPITISVLDDGGSTVVLHGTAVIADAALTPDAGPGPALSGFVEGNLSGPINLGSFTDANTSAPASDFTATVCWNDLGTAPINDCAALPAGSVVSNGSAGAFKVVANHVFREEGTFTPSVKITDVDGSMIAALLNSPATISVADHPLTVVRQPTLTAQVKKSFTKTVATFNDGTTGEPVTDYNAVICWYTYNCSTASGLNVTWTVGKITSNGAGGWTVTGTWKYAAAGAYNGSVSVTDIGGAPTVIVPLQVKAK